MRWTLAGCMFLVGCSGSSPQVAEPVDAVGAWTADYLVNTSPDTSGDEVNPFGVLTIETAVYQDSSDEYQGKAMLASTVFAPQGSLDKPKMDGDGEVLMELVGTATLRGTWSARAYEGNTSLDVTLNCEEIKLSKQRPDLMAVCGSPGFDATVSASCSRPDGATTLQCGFGAGTVVFHRK